MRNTTRINQLIFEEKGEGSCQMKKIVKVKKKNKIKKNLGK